jgi:hypothetical protein
MTTGKHHFRAVRGESQADQHQTRGKQFHHPWQGDICQTGVYLVKPFFFINKTYKLKCDTVTEYLASKTQVTEIPMTESQVTESQATQLPMTEYQVTEIPMTESQRTEIPITESQATQLPMTDYQVIEIPSD